jgi:TolB-like protein
VIAQTVVVFSEVHMKNLSVLLVVTLSALLICGCANPGAKRACSEQSYEFVANSQLLAANYRAADALISQVKRKLTLEQPILVTTIVNIDDLEKSSTFGRVASENIASRFSQAGYSVIEMKFSNNIYMKRNEGELVLTREITDVARNQNAQAVVLGTYGTSGVSVFVTVKLVKPDGNIVSAAYDYVLPVDSEIRSLIRSAGVKPSDLVR